jgi:very-short-patch-repair endonuclease
MRRNKTEYLLNPKICKNCNEVIIWDKRNNSFCGSSCSASYNNSISVKSEITRSKISNSLKGKTRKPSVRIDKISKLPKYPKKLNCVTCDKVFEVNYGKRNKTCSLECRSILKSNKSKISQNILVNKGLHKGWISRNVLSYPEKFFIEVLKNNNIFHLSKLNHKKGKYFLDFYFEHKSLCLEIDGKQHELPERKASDIIRDSYLESEGIVVHRIPWKSINSQDGKDYIEEEIEFFMDLYNKLSSNGLNG